MKAKEIVPPSKPRNFVVKNQKTTGAGAHKNKKLAAKHGDNKHKNRNFTSESSEDFFDSLEELYNPETSFPLEWDNTFAPKERNARAYDRQGNYIDIKFVPVRDDIVNIEFSRNDNYEMTGQGDAERVFATVLKAIKEYLTGFKPKIILFSAKGESRSKLYQRLINRFASSFGYKQFDTSKLSPETKEKFNLTGTNVMVLRRV